MVAKYATPIAWTKFFEYDITVITTVDNCALSFTAVQKDVRSGPCTLHAAFISNTVASGTDPIYFSFFDNISSGLTAGTTPSVMLWPVPNGRILLLDFPDGFEFENGMSLLACGTAGDSNTTAPAEAVDVILHTTQGVSR